MASAWLSKVKSPTLLLVGELDNVVIDLNREAMQHLACTTEMRLIPDASHLFEEPGALEAVAHDAAEWFGRYLPVTPS